jgi:mannitol-1-phosphate/altronate dehydrogenase
MSEIIILGAGAIGRGFLPWLFGLNLYGFIFVDINSELVNQLNQKKEYLTYRVKSNKLEEMVVPIKRAYHLSEFHLKDLNVAAVFMNVGPRNCLSAASCLKGVKCPIILCENDPQTVELVKNALNYSRVYFAIPDVITSNTASSELLTKDPLSVITEDGVLFVDERANEIKGTINFCNESELEKQWTAKLYLHNTPHCIAAYLGALVGVKYIHEAMELPEIKKIVTGSMSEMLTALKLKWDIPHSFLDWYADKEIKRFLSKFLYDPVSRVGREPLRKLKLEERLIGAAQICLSLGFIPQNILIGIVSALLFENQLDSDHQLSFMHRTISPNFLLTYVLGLRKGEVLEIIMRERLEKITLQLETIIENSRKSI